MPYIDKNTNTRKQTKSSSQIQISACSKSKQPCTRKKKQKHGRIVFIWKLKAFFDSPFPLLPPHTHTQTLAKTNPDYTNPPSLPQSSNKALESTADKQQKLLKQFRYCGTETALTNKHTMRTPRHLSLPLPSCPQVLRSCVLFVKKKTSIAHHKLWGESSD